jgi:hypothetical protein
MIKREPYVTSPYLGLHIDIKSYPVADADYINPRSSKVVLAGEFMELSGGKLARPAAGDFVATNYVTVKTADGTVAGKTDGNKMIATAPILRMVLRDVIIASTDVKYRKQLEVFNGPTPINFKTPMFEHDSTALGSPWAVGDFVTVGPLTKAGVNDYTGKVGLTKLNPQVGGGLIYGRVVAVPDAEGMLEVNLVTPYPYTGVITVA